MTGCWITIEAVGTRKRKNGSGCRKCGSMSAQGRLSISQSRTRLIAHALSAKLMPRIGRQDSEICKGQGQRCVLVSNLHEKLIRYSNTLRIKLQHQITHSQQLLLGQDFSVRLVRVQLPTTSARVQLPRISDFLPLEITTRLKTLRHCLIGQ